MRWQLIYNGVIKKSTDKIIITSCEVADIYCIADHLFLAKTVARMIKDNTTRTALNRLLAHHDLHFKLHENRITFEPGAMIG